VGYDCQRWPTYGQRHSYRHRFDPNTNTWSLFFDGSDVGMTNSNADIDAFDIIDEDDFLLSILGTATLPNVGSVTNADIVRFHATSLGATTAGTFFWYFDGSDVGLTTTSEDIDGIDQLADGRLLISTSGSASVTGASGADEDILAFTPAPGGVGDDSTSGTWAIYFDGSDVGLANSSNEDVGGVWVDSTPSDVDGKIYLSTLGAFSVAGASGDGADVFICDSTAVGATTACTYGPGLYWDGSANGFSGEVIDAVALSAASFGGTLVQTGNDADQSDAGLGAADDDANPPNPDDDEQTERLFLPIVVK
jgi:hypothetical protein